MIKSHAELQKFHYQALKNPSYQLEGLADCLREEVMMNQPLMNIPVVHVNTVEYSLKSKDLEAIKKTRELVYDLQKRLNKHIDWAVEEKKKKKSKYD